MLTLVVSQGPDEVKGKRFALGEGAAIIGRDAQADVSLPSQAVSRRHARIVCVDGAYFLDDLGSTNGIFLNNQRVSSRTPLTENDELRLANFVLKVLPPEAEQIVREKVEASAGNQTLFALNPALKLQVVLELSRHLSMTLEQQPLLTQLLEHLLRLFPLADQAMVVLCEEDRLVVRGQRTRSDHEADFPFSRTLIKQALADGVGILSSDVQQDARFDASRSLATTEAHSLLCVPLIGHDSRRLGVLQLACTRMGHSFQGDDLNLFTTIGLQVAVVLENVTLHAERLREAQFRKELAMAREIQQSVLPTNFAAAADFGCELFARVWPAREVSGDLYDFFPTEDGRFAFFVGDVSGKGMPAALFMFAVRSLGRHLATQGTRPAETLLRLHHALAAENAAAMFVTLLHGTLDPRSGELLLSCGGHPMPLVHRADGRVESITLPSGRILGCDVGAMSLTDTALSLAAGETLILYTDGFTEAFAPDDTMFGLERLQQTLGEGGTGPLQPWAERIRDKVIRFIGGPELQDDLTLFMLRRG